MIPKRSCAVRYCQGDEAFCRELRSFAAGREKLARSSEWRECSRSVGEGGSSRGFGIPGTAPGATAAGPKQPESREREQSRRAVIAAT